jgi:hypothetical protein
MDCPAVAENLLAYHVGEVEDADLAKIESHLVGCRSCLEAYLAIKRAADRAVFERPRPEVRDRLRAEVVRAFPKKKSTRPLAFLGRRIPLYQGVALAAVAAVIALTAPSVVRRLTRPSVDSAPMVDTSRTRAESLSIY